MAQMADIVEEWVDVGLRQLLGMPKPCCIWTLFSISQLGTTWHVICQTFMPDDGSTILQPHRMNCTAFTSQAMADNNNNKVLIS